MPYKDTKKQTRFLLKPKTVFNKLENRHQSQVFAQLKNILAHFM